MGESIMRRVWTVAIVFAIAAVPVLSGIGRLVANEPPADELEQRDARYASELAHLTLPLLSMTVEGTPLARPEASLMRWSNPTAGRVYGNVFLWTDGVRPVAITNLYKFFEPYTSFTVEMIAFDDRPIVLSLKGNTLWKPRRPEPGWEAVQPEVTPSTVPAARLGQMRAIARQVHFELDDRRNDANGTRQDLRLVERPIYRYPAPSAGSNASTNRPLDGALFAYVISNDPEAWLLVETTATGYRVRCFRMNTDGLRAKGTFGSAPISLGEWPHLPWEEVNSNGAYAGRNIEEPSKPGQ